MKSILTYSLIIVAAFLFIGCERQEISYDSKYKAEILISVDWQALSQKPTGMSILFYPENGDKPLIYQTNNIYTNSIKISQGRYNIVVFNQIPSDFKNIEFTGINDFNSLEVYTKQYTPTWYKYENEIIGREPDVVAVAIHKGFEVTPEMIDEAKRLTRNEPQAEIHLSPKVILHATTVSMRIDGINNVRSVRGAIKGLAHGYLITQQRPNNRIATHILEEWSIIPDNGSFREGVILCEFFSFGLPEEVKRTDSSTVLDLSILLIDNKTIIDKSYDISNRIKHEENVITLTLGNGTPAGVPSEPSDAPIIPPEVEPEEGGEEGGFNPSIDDWGDSEIIDIPL